MTFAVQVENQTVIVAEMIFQFADFFTDPSIRQVRELADTRLAMTKAALVDFLKRLEVLLITDIESLGTPENRFAVALVRFHVVGYRQTPEIFDPNLLQNLGPDVVQIEVKSISLIVALLLAVLLVSMVGWEMFMRHEYSAVWRYAPNKFRETVCAVDNSAFGLASRSLVEKVEARVQ